MAGRLPNLVVIGAPKAGTGSLFSYLAQHPDVCAADKKELGYFSYFHPGRHSGAVPPLDDYRAHFAHCVGQRYAVEASPSYCYGGRPIIEAIQATLTEPRIILALRDPVARLWSAYTFQRELGNITQFRTFEDYLAACEEKGKDGGGLVPRDHLHGLYIGFYDRYVPLWLEAFGDDLKVVFTEQMASSAAPVMADVFSWLDIDPSPASSLDVSPRNPTNHPRSTQAARIVYSAKRGLERRGRVPAVVREPLRRLYQRANTGRPPAGMSEETRHRVLELYRQSTAATALALRAHGYDEFPSWMHGAAEPR
jgi:hypothetical protein